jgi:sulfhydrogenase subunit beta (sulfur reductase)
MVSPQRRMDASGVERNRHGQDRGEPLRATKTRAAERPAKLKSPVIIERQDFGRLLEALRSLGYTVIGPTVRDNAVVYDEVRAVGDLPIGWGDTQDAGTYRLTDRGDGALFGFNLGPHSWKQFLHPPALRLYQAERTGSSFRVVPEPIEPPKLAFLGVRACELHAIAIQDHVFIGGPYVDPSYQARRPNVCLVAVNCGRAAGTCFCVSMETGPRATSGYDLSLTEVLAPDRHYFVAEVGTSLGAQILDRVPHREATEAELAAGEAVVAGTAAQMGRTLETTGLPELLKANLEHPRWEQVASRCLTCGNCTMVCPTCFCTTVQDVTDLAGERAERLRVWDSCFTTAFSYIAGGSIRASARSRYRQWLTHKLSTWHDQFGTSGCVGCGRCITWCPARIDLTEEAAAIRAAPQGTQGATATTEAAR